MGQQPPVGQDLLIIENLWSHSNIPHLEDSSGRVISPTQRFLPDNTIQSQEKNIHAPDGIRTHILNKRMAADPRLRPRGHWYRHLVFNLTKKYIYLQLLHERNHLPKELLTHFHDRLQPRYRNHGRDHICKLCVYLYYNKLNNNAEGYLCHVRWFLYQRPKNLPAVTVLAFFVGVAGRKIREERWRAVVYS